MIKDKNAKDTATLETLGLAPMAVLPAYQCRGMGSQLVEAGLHTCHHTPYGVGVVLGHLLSALRVYSSQALGHCVGA